MSSRLRTILASGMLCAVALCSQAHASILDAFNYTDQLNQVTLTNREVILRPTTSTDPNAVNLPNGWFREVVGDISDLPQVGDLFVQIYDGTTLNVGGAPNVWQQSDTDRFEGYGVQEIKSLTATPVGTKTYVDIVFKTPSVDPFGILAANEAFRLYVDTGPSATKIDESTSWQTGVNSVTDGTLWASFGPDVLPSGMAQGGGTTLGYGDSTATVNNAGGIPPGQAYFGLNVITGPPGIVFTGVNDSNHPKNQNGVTADVSAYARANFLGNNNYPSNSVWRYTSSDPFAFKATPEPASLLVWTVLVGTGFVVGARGRRRKRA